MGWNEQQSSLTITLVDDPCEVPAGKTPKVYYPKPGQRVETREADPGFIKPTIGIPVYFRIGGDAGTSSDIFEFAGIIQSWTEDFGTGGNPVYTVQIVDPRLILQNLEIIVSDYAGGVGSVYNIINAYGWLESEGYACPHSVVNGASFGSPAGGFCGAANNNEGTPWNQPAGPGGLRYAVQRLLSGYPSAFSPYGYGSYRGPDPDSDKASDGGYYGIIEDSPEDTTDAALAAAGGHKYVSQYYIDISEVPFTPAFYRIAGPSISLLDMISQVLTDSGCDYYIELLVTQQKKKCIKVRVVERAVAPSLGDIEEFVNETVNVTSKNIGRELRNEPTQAFVYGGYVQTIYQQDQFSVKSDGEIIQFWGYDAAHNLTVAYNNTLTGRELGEWQVYLDIRPLNLTLQNTIAGGTAPGRVGNHYISINEREIRMALAGFDPWMNYALTYNAGVGTNFGNQLRSVLNINGPQIHFGHVGLNDKGTIGRNFSNLLSFGIAFQPDQDPQDPKNGDLRKVHDFIQNWADTYYGKQFLVQLPYVCWCNEADSGQIMYSDNPTQDGGWPAPGVTNILGLPVDSVEGTPGVPTDHFTDDVNKILPIARYYKTNTGAVALEGDWIVYTPAGGIESIYVKAQVEEKPLNYFGYATAVLKVDNPIEMSGLEKDLADIDPSFGGLIELAHQSGLSALDISNLKFALTFSPDNQRGTDGSIAIVPRRRTPSEAAVPMKSNTTRYGPQAFKGPPGQVHFVADDGLVPWEYAGYTNLMNGSPNVMSEHARSAVTYMQEGERGSINFPGHPTRRLGAELRSAQQVMSFLSIQNDTFKVLNKSFDLKKIDIGSWDGEFGPNITNIQINIGENGFTTNYTLSTFSPSFGRFAKYNANRLKIIGRQRTSFLKAQRERNKLARALRAAETRTSRSLKDMKNKRQSKQDAPNANTIKTGGMGEGKKTTDDHTTVLTNSTNLSPRTLRMGNPEDWKHQAITSNDGFFRPVSNDQKLGTMLPRYAKTANGRAAPWDLCWTERPHQSRHINPPFNGDHFYKPCIIDIDYFDPYAYPGRNKHDDNPNAARNHTDISIVAHGTVPPKGSMQLDAYVREGNSFPESLRMLAMKGPMLMHGWGFDLDGKPVPNEADTEGAASGGTFKAVGLTDRFLSHYLRKPHTWPVAPVDLRFDRARGVWTQPIQYKIIQAANTGGILAAGTSRDDVQALDMGTVSNPVYDSAGASIPNTSGTIEVNNPSWGADIAQGDSFFAVYDSIACKYYPLVGGAPPVFYNTGICYDSIAWGEQCHAQSDRGCWTSNTIIVGSGLQAAQVAINQNADTVGSCGDQFPSGTGTFISLRVPVFDVGSTGTAGSTGRSVIKKLGSNCIADWGTLIFGSGLAVYSGGRSDQTGPTQDCDFVYIEATGVCEKKAVNVSCAQAASSWCGKYVEDHILATSAFGEACKGLIAGPGLFMYDVTGAKTIGSVDVSGYQYIETALSAGLGCGVAYPGGQRNTTSHSTAHGGEGYVQGLETINLGCGLSGNGPTSCDAGAGYAGNSKVCDITINIEPLCYHGVGSVRVVHDVCCSGGSGLVIRYKNLRFTDCGLFTGVLPYEDCEGTEQPGDYL
jgi:hypothetical protein